MVGKKESEKKKATREIDAIITEVRSKFATNPQKAYDALVAIDPSTLNVAAAQKLGRAVRSFYRTGGVRGSYSLSDYHLGPSKEGDRSPLVGGDYSYDYRFRGGAPNGRYNVTLKLAPRSESKYWLELAEKSPLDEMSDFFKVTQAYFAVGKFKKAREILDRAEKYLTNDLRRGNVNYRFFPVDVSKRNEEDVKSGKYDSVYSPLIMVKQMQGDIDKILTDLGERKAKDISSKLTPIVAFVALFAGIFFLSNKFTGNVIGISSGKSSLVGLGLLAVGLVSGFFWLKNKRK